MNLSRQHLLILKERLAQGVAMPIALADVLGDTLVGDGLWRLYSNAWPDHGVRPWNTGSPFLLAWHDLLPAGLWFFGEDVFGNQLCLQEGAEEVQLWNHEDGSLQSLEADPVALMVAVFDQGLDWLDAYGDGSLEAARTIPPPDRSLHLHWRTPLILGGAVSVANLEPIAREPHLIGHAALWRQVRDLPPGAEFVPA